MSPNSLAINSSVQRLRLYLFAVLIYFGIASLFAVPVLQRDHTAQVVRSQLVQYLKQSNAHRSAAAVAPAPISGAPVSISIPRLGITLPIAPGYYNSATRKWTLDSKHVFTDNYTDPNPLVGTNQSHVSFLYGHDIPGVLVKTSQLVYGDRMTINTGNGYQFQYYYDKSAILNPTDSSVLNQVNTGDPVVLSTCTGTWYQFRHAMYFRLVNVQKIAAAPAAPATTSPAAATGVNS
jgi:LPXTG-site transpeptidase (sortase) family protein